MLYRYTVEQIVRDELRRHGRNEAAANYQRRALRDPCLGNIITTAHRYLDVSRQRYERHSYGRGGYGWTRTWRGPGMYHYHRVVSSFINHVC